MKKTLLYTITMIFAAAISAYGYDEGKAIGNGITDFNGKTIDTLSDLIPAVPGAMDLGYVEGAGAGGIRSEDPAAEFYNGITIFSGRGVSTRSDLDYAWEAIGMKDKVVESANAGGMREEEVAPVLNNSVTDFTGESHDSL
jgi:hypothetical protein